jgi:pantoate--beta-alanine ligase
LRFVLPTRTMYLFKRVSDVRAYLKDYHLKNRPLGFIPTMGALHDGHLSLIRQSIDAAHITVASIFVNPSQFNDPSDLEKYPRTPERDLRLLQQAGCHAVFMPPPEEVYPPGLDTTLQIDFGQLTTSMEGLHRPGHFDGVAQVVKRLLDIIQPTHLYMGQKDYQQLMVVRHMAKVLGLPTEVVMAPIVREKNGLAMSSRNIRLSSQGKQQAARIYQTLLASKAWLTGYTPQQISQKAKEELEAAGLQAEYFDLVDGDTLLPIQNINDTTATIVACVAAWCEGVRLIDNIILQDQ